MEIRRGRPKAAHEIEVITMFTFTDEDGVTQTVQDENMCHAYHADCMKFMRSCPDRFFDLAVVDPPYGSACDTGGVLGGIDSAECLTATKKVCRTGGKWAAKFGKKS